MGFQDVKRLDIFQEPVRSSLEEGFSSCQRCTLKSKPSKLNITGPAIMYYRAMQIFGSQHLRSYLSWYHYKD